MTRDDRGRFLAGGPSPNPAGRPKGFAGVARAILDATGDGQELVDFALATFRDPHTPEADRWKAFAWLSERALGKALQPIELAAIVASASPSAIDPGVILSRLSVDVIKALLDAAGAQDEPSPLEVGQLDEPKPVDD